MRALSALRRSRPVAILTAHDAPSASLAARAKPDAILVGDSLAMTTLGQPNTAQLELNAMVHHTIAVRAGAPNLLLIADLPFGSYLTPGAALASSLALIKQGGADAVKLEGGRRVAPMVRALADAGIGVVGHVGLTPQSAAVLGGFSVQARTASAAAELLADARAVEEAGASAIVLEMVPSPVAAAVTEALGVPTIGIGAGVHTSGQVQVWHDVVGMYHGRKPRFSRQYADVNAAAGEALAAYVSDVSSGAFPAAEHCFGMPEAEEARLGEALARVGRAGGATAAPAHDAGAGPRLVSSITEWRRLRRALPYDAPIGLVPTMGALHEGHLELVRAARARDGLVAVSIFVNPTQFGESADLSNYPRTLERDLELLRGAGADYALCPTVDDMYPLGAPAAAASPRIDFGAIGGCAEAAARPGHHNGAGTAVAMLLNIVRPRHVYFGQKDALQATLMRRLVEGLHYDVGVVVCPTARAEDGLALSSRNVRLADGARALAPRVYEALRALQASHAAGERDAALLREAAASVIRSEGGGAMELEYVALERDADGASVSLLPSEADGSVVESFAVSVCGVRLLATVLL